MIEIKHLTKKMNGFTVLDDVNLTIEKSSIYGLIGVNGAGKSTLIRHMVGSYYSDSGEILYDGESIIDNVPLKERLIYIPDAFATTFGSNIQEIARFYSKIYPRWSQARYEQLISRFKQDQLMNFNHFSKGMQKQVAFILALSCMPDYLIMDEPFDGLDPLIRSVIWDILIDDVTTRQMTILISSHHLKELDVMCEKVGLLHDGKVVMEEKLSYLKEHIHKIQLAFHDDASKAKAQNLVSVLYEEQVGKIHTWIIEGKEEDILTKLSTLNPVILEKVDLNLEEIFTYTMGGELDAFKELFAS